jgi:hypothetical protein
MQEKAIRSYWTLRGKNGHKGLVLLDEAMHHWTKTGDWTKLGLFLKLSGANKAKLTKIMKLAFGEANIKIVAKAKHPSKLGFELKRDGAFAEHGNGWPLEQQNGYGIIRKALDDGKSFDAQDLTKAVNEAMGKPDKGKEDKTAIQELEAVYKYLTIKMKDSDTIKAHAAAFYRSLERSIEAKKAAIEPDF